MGNTLSTVIDKMKAKFAMHRTTFDLPTPLSSPFRLPCGSIRL